MTTHETTHETTAIGIAKAVAAGQAPAVDARESARQGDVILRRVGAAAQAPSPTHEAGLLIARGSHGEHRLCAPGGARQLDGGLLDLPEGGLLVHTDQPHGRHGAIRLAPGRWLVQAQRELGLDQVIRRVQD